MTDIFSLARSDVNERAAAKAALDAAEEQLRSLCAAHASTFVAVERRNQAVQTALNDLLSNIDISEQQIAKTKAALRQEDEEGEGTLAALSEKHRVRRRTLLQHSHLLEILELPSLMDACVRSSLYDDALSIAAFSNTLERRHTEKNPVVLRVIGQIRSRQQDLRRHLLHCLKSYVTMPECLEIVTALRRLNSIDLERQPETNIERTHDGMELSLQVDFLEARDCWLEKPGSSGSAMSGSSALLRNTDPAAKSAEQLLDTIERYRTRVFEIATQFNAIFRAQMNHRKGSSVSLLSMWSSRKIESFLSMLAMELENMKESAQLRDALDASIFFAASMGRLGADFTPRLPPMFEKKMHDIVKQNWKDGVMQLGETLKICREAGVASPLVSSSHVNDDEDDEGLANGTSSSSTAAQTSSGADGPPPPPRQLMAYPPLARLLNAFLTGMNELRRCLLPGTFKLLRDSLNMALQKATSILQSNERAVLTPGLRGDALQLRKVASEMRKVLKDVMEPYVRSALEFALGNDAVATDLYRDLEAAVAAGRRAKGEGDATTKADGTNAVKAGADGADADAPEEGPSQDEALAQEDGADADKDKLEPATEPAPEPATESVSEPASESVSDPPAEPLDGNDDDDKEDDGDDKDDDKEDDDGDDDKPADTQQD